MHEQGCRAPIPVKDNPLLQSKPKEVAAGIPAVLSTMNHGLTRMGAIRSLSNLTRVNSFYGSLIVQAVLGPIQMMRELHLNSVRMAKAVADEGTKARANPEFWSQWTFSTIISKNRSLV